MAFNRPTLKTLIDRVSTDIETGLPGANARLRRTPEHVLGRALAGVAHGLHGHLRHNANQVIPDTAENEVMKRWASIYGLTPKDPAKATGSITITGTPASVAPAGTIWQRSDGALFSLDADATIGGGGSVSAAVTADEAGSASNTAASTTVSLQSPIAGVNADATVDADGITGGADAESDERILQRLLLRMQTPPTSGGPGDYVKWALEVAGVTRAWEYPKAMGVGTVAVRFVRDDDVSLIPDAGEVATVQAHIDARAPVLSTVTVLAPIANPLNFTIAVTPDTAAVRAAVEAELEDLLLRRAEPGGTIFLSQIDEAISLAAGEESHVLTAPSVDVVEATGYMTTMGTITWA